MIAVYGGSFNPVTIAHMKIVESVLNIDEIHKIILLPLADNYGKPDLAKAIHRYNMLKLCFSDNRRVKISSLDMRTPEQLTTIEYMDIFAEIFDEQLAFVMGTDNLEHFTIWNDSEELLQKYYHVVIKRDEDDINKIVENDELLTKYKNKIIVIDNIGIDKETLMGMCATNVRSYFREGRFTDLDKCIVEDVKAYMMENKVY